MIFFFLSQALKEKDDLKSQLLSAVNQIENLRKELNDVLTKRAQQEELLHCKEVKLNEMESHRVSLEEEIKEVQGTVKKLEDELKKQVFLKNQMQAEKEHLKTEIATINSFHKKDQERLLEMQADVKNLSAVRVELTNRIAEEEKAKKELLKSLSDLQKQQGSSHEEMISANRQLKMEREIHQQELADLRSELQNVKIKHEQNVQELKKLLKKEKDDAEAQIRMLKVFIVKNSNVRLPPSSHTLPTQPLPLNDGYKAQALKHLTHVIANHCKSLKFGVKNVTVLVLGQNFSSKIAKYICL